jgi:hypothetical protein
MFFPLHRKRSILFIIILFNHIEMQSCHEETKNPPPSVFAILQDNDDICYEEMMDVTNNIEEFEEDNGQWDEAWDAEDGEEDEWDEAWDEEDEAENHAGEWEDDDESSDDSNDDESSDDEYTHSTINDIWYEMGCEEVFSSERPIHSQQEWKQAIKIYESIVQDSKLDPVNNGFSVGFEAKQADKFKGRGVYATQPIKKGDLVWSTKRTARFDNGDDYKLFLSQLETAFACDVIQWAYVQDVNDNIEGEEEELNISVDLDEGCFCNGEGFDSLPGNVGCHEGEAVKFEGGCKSNYFALVDIKAGEEFVCKYGEFAHPDGWIEFGL